MNKKEIYIVLSHYDKDGRKTRSIQSVKAECFEYGGFEFGIYYDKSRLGLNDTKSKWKLIDVATGKVVSDGLSKDNAIRHFLKTPLFNRFTELTQTVDYNQLIEELQRMKREKEGFT